MEAPGTTPDDSPAASPSLHSLRTSLARAFPAARVTWLALVLLGVWGVVVFRGAGATSLLVLPAAAAILDLGFQSLRFERFRFPDGALATGLFLALILTPTVPLLAAGAVTLAAIGVKHVLRVRGRPILNPAASGVVLGAFAFGLAPAWWVGIGPLGELAMVAAGVAVVLRSPKNWRIPATFFLVFAPLSVLLRFTYGTSLAPSVIVLGVLDPSTLFFGLFMVTEPRTAPSNVHLHLVYATLVGWGAAFLPAYLPTTGTLVALLLVGFGFGTYRAARRLASSAGATARAHRSETSSPTGRLPWTPASRAGAGMLVLIVVAAIASAGITPSATPAANIAHPSHYSGGSPPPSSGGGGGGQGGITAASCLKNNSSIPASTAGMLHSALGPSVLLSYDASTGLTVFYDPVNQVTVTETDLYEDYGYAEFNGDDYAVSGCSP